jgi:hypothetical protein
MGLSGREGARKLLRDVGGHRESFRKPCGSTVHFQVALTEARNYCCTELLNVQSRHSEALLVSFDHYGQELRAQLGRAAAQGGTYHLINSRELHASLGGGFPSAKAQMISCRLAMQTEMQAGDVMLVDETSAAGTTVRYVLPRVA